MEDHDATRLNGHERIDVELFRYVEASLDQEEVFHVLGFEFLQRYNLVRIQNKLTKIRESIHADLRQSCDEESLKNTLSEYSTSYECDRYIDVCNN